MAITQPPAISGLGGIGKTQTAIEYCYRHLKDYKVILWIKSEAKTDIDNSYLELAHRLGLIDISNPKELHNTHITSLLKEWLINNPNWLMVLDNLEYPNLIKEYVPNNHNGYILITSRSQSLKGFAQIINLKKMSTDTGSLFLLKRTYKLPLTDKNLHNASDDDKQAAKSIVEAMDGLALALEQAGAYIHETQCSLPDYLLDFNDIRNTITLLDNNGEDVNDHKSVFATFKLAFKKVKEKSPIAAQILEACSFLSPDLIPIEIFTISADFLGDELIKLKDNSFEFNKAIKALLDYSLLERDSNNHSLSIHRLVQTVVRELMDDKNRIASLQSLICALEKLLPPSTQTLENWATYQRILPSTLSLIPLITTDCFDSKQVCNEQAYLLFNQMGVYCQTQAIYPQALACHYASLKVLKSTFPIRHICVAASLNNIGETYRQLSEYKQALEYFQDALAIHNSTPGDTDPSIADILNNIGTIYSSQARYDDALTHYKKALSITILNSGEIHPNTAKSLNNIGETYRHQRKYPQALKCYLKALDIYKKTVGENHHYCQLS